MKIIYSTVVKDGRKIRKAIILEKRKCEVCGQEYQPSRQDSIICKDCSGKRNQGVYAKVGKVRRWLILRSKLCEECGCEFQPKKRDSRYCSRACGKKAESKRNADKYSARGKKWYQDNLEEAKTKRKERYWSDPEKYRKDSNDWRKNNVDKDKECQARSKDNAIHGGRRKEILDDNQVLLCRSCHAKVHGLNLKNKV